MVLRARRVRGGVSVQVSTFEAAAEETRRGPRIGRTGGATGEEGFAQAKKVRNKV